MKITTEWLNDWVATGPDINKVSDTLTMAGLEVDSVEPVSTPISKLVVGKVLSVKKHPNADKLNVCRVDVGKAKPLQIVCGASNVAENMKVVVALVGCTLPNGTQIKSAELRGVKSSGMLCSAAELGMEEESAGLLSLDNKARVGDDAYKELVLDDTVIDIDLTPNRGDCLSIRGIARELAALTGKKLKTPKRGNKSLSTAVKNVTVKLTAKKECPRYVGRVIEGIDPGAETPLWMQERLRRCGLRPIHPVVDVTNYVMLELGQPMHGFDLDKLAGPINVRLSRDKEKLELLNGQTVTLQKNTLLITDKTGPIALAGIMGGEKTSVGEGTTNVFFESAYFDPDAIAGKARTLGLHTDSSHRFERGVDPNLQEEAIEYASALLTQIAGGKVGKLIKTENRPSLPRRLPISLTSDSVNELLGLALSSQKIENYLVRLGMKVSRSKPGNWRVTAPSYRFDISRDVDLIEEVARVHGYENLPTLSLQAAADMQPVPDGVLADSRIQSVIVDHGYHEVITYSFVDPNLQALIDPETASPRLNNPISEDMAVMRSSMWPGLIAAAIHNLNRQQYRVRLFEVGTCFLMKGKQVLEQDRVAAIAVGTALPTQWSQKGAEVDFYDIKGDLEALFSLARISAQIRYKPTQNPALHPGQGADLYLEDVKIGSLGRLHPGIQAKLDVEAPIYLFEIEKQALKQKNVPEYHPISRYPAIRRDISLVVDAQLPAQAVLDCIRSSAGKLLSDLELFDEYRGEGIDSGRKSLTLGLILQDSSRTLKEEVVETVMGKVLTVLQTDLGAELRT
ncbi:MAG: phenylalanine--tRNA ligase subunit beta [Acidiferrobacterales bacterium]